jgi:hypothetical protein
MGHAGIQGVHLTEANDIAKDWMPACAGLTECHIGPLPAVPSL